MIHSKHKPKAALNISTTPTSKRIESLQEKPQYLVSKPWFRIGEWNKRHVASQITVFANWITMFATNNNAASWVSVFFLPFKSQHLCYSEINYMSICSLVKTTRTSEISQLPASFACNRAQERCQASDGSGRPWERNMAIFKWTVWKLDTFMSTIHEIFWEMSWRWIWYSLRYRSKKKYNLKMHLLL